MTDIFELCRLPGFSVVCEFLIWIVCFGTFCGLLYFAEWLIIDRKESEMKKIKQGVIYVDRF